MKPRKLLWGIASGVLAIGLLVPGLAAADTVPERCGANVCVRAILDSMSISCFTNSDRRPQCAAIARVGATGRSVTSVPHGIVEYSASTTGGKVTNPVPAFVPCCRAPRYAQGQRTWTGRGMATVTSNLRSPFSVGPVGGCLQYEATFFVVARAGTFIPFENIPYDPEVVSNHLHSIRATKGYCVPQ